MSSPNKIRIVIIEPSPVIRQGLKSLFEEQAPELSVTATFGDFQAFRKNVPDAIFDMILVNPTIINFHKAFDVRPLFSDYSDAILVAILYGYVDSETLGSFDGSLDIYDDGEKITTKLKKLTKNFTNQQNGNKNDGIDLSDREKEILVAVAKGMTNKEIADKHHISIHTVTSHRKNITRKTGIKTISGLTIYAIFNGLLKEEEV